MQGNIQSLGVFELDKYNADAWLLSPPCQPYTRQGLPSKVWNASLSRPCKFSSCSSLFLVTLIYKMLFLGLQKHSADARAFSFIKIIELIQHMLQPPKLLFVENVVGFEVCINHIYGSASYLYVIAKNCLLVADFWYTQADVGNIWKTWFCYTRIYIEPTAIWNSIF